MSSSDKKKSSDSKSDSKLKKLSKGYIVAGIAILLIVAYVVWDIVSSGPLTSFFGDRERMISTVNELGPLAPLAYIALQILQTVVAPIPGNLVGGIGGFLFGWWGVLWTTIGATVGAALVFWVSRRFGRGLVERFVKKESLEKFDFILNSQRASWILLIIFLIPGLPDDIVCYLAGLTKVPLSKLIVIFALGRLPAVVGNNFIGMGIGDGNIGIVTILAVVMVVLLGIIYWQQDNLMRFLKKEYKTKDADKIRKKAIQDISDDGKLNNSIAKTRKKS